MTPVHVSGWQAGKPEKIQLLYVSLKEEAEKWKGERGRERECGWRSWSAEKREVGCRMSEWGVMVKCLRSSMLSLCCPHGVLARVCVCVCSPTIKLRWSPLMCQTTGSHHTLPCHIRRVCSVPVGPPSIHPPIHNIQRLIPSLCCRAGSPEEGWGGSTQIDEDYLLWQMGTVSVLRPPPGGLYCCLNKKIRFIAFFSPVQTWSCVHTARCMKNDVQYLYFVHCWV